MRTRYTQNFQYISESYINSKANFETMRDPTRDPFLFPWSFEHSFHANDERSFN